MPSLLKYAAFSGSDIAASGAGPATAITGASATNGTGNIVNLDGTPDLSGVAVNDVIWVNSATTERHLSRITAVDDAGDTVTTEDLLVLSTGVSWAIGGERQTLENDTGNQDWLDYKHGWTIEFDIGTYNNAAQISPVEQGDDIIGFLTFKAKAGIVGLPEIAHDTSNARTFYFSNDNHRINLLNLHISNETTWVGGNKIYLGGVGGISNTIGCDIEGKAVSGGGEAINGASTNIINIINNYIHGTMISGISSAAGGRQTGLVQGNWIDGASDYGIRDQSTSSYATTMYINNLVTNCGIDGIWIDGNASSSVKAVVNNTIYNCSGNGINILAELAEGVVNVRGNIIVSCGGYGIAAELGTSTAIHTLCDYNAFYNNTSGEIQNAVDQGNNITLTATPFVDAANDDFNLNDTAGGGAACKDILPFAAGAHV